MKYVRLTNGDDGRVFEVFDPVDDSTGVSVTPDAVFPEAIAVQFIEAPDEVRVGWLRGSDGQFSAPPPPPPPPPLPAPLPAPDEQAKLLFRLSELLIDDHIDRQAKAMGYASIVTASSYADEPAVPRFQMEGVALRAWRSQVYAAAFAIQAEVQAGVRPIPSPLELIGLLPVFVAPEV